MQCVLYCVLLLFAILNAFSVCDQAMQAVWPDVTADVLCNTIGSTTTAVIANSDDSMPL